MNCEEIIKKSRINFKSGVPEKLFRMANAQCSVPRCKKPTTGPFLELGESMNMGVACHIYSASEDGPRGRGGKDAEFISSQENGIWCCQYHAALIDKKGGVDYTAATLFAWKKLIEATIQKKMNDVPSPLGWVESIEFLELSEKKPKVVLSRYTLLTGRNNSGKTALLEAAAAISNSKHFERISHTYSIKNGIKVGIRVEAKTTYTTVDTFSKELHVIADNFVIRRKDGDTPCLLPPGDIEVVFCSDNDDLKLSNEDDVHYLMRVLNVDSTALREIINIGPSAMIDGVLHFQDEWEEIDDDDECDNEERKRRLRLDDYGNKFEELILTRVRNGVARSVPYTNLSTSEKGRLITGLAITKAKQVAKQKLTLFLIDGLITNFDEYNFENLLRILQKEDFQAVVVLPPIRKKSITEVVNGNLQLKKLDYLSDWKLQTLDSPV